MSLKEKARRLTAERVLVLAVLALWAAGLLVILGHRLFVTNDSLSNYAHVWYASEQIWHGHGIPYSFPEIGHGDALAFPYGFIPWVTAALLRPVLGDWVVTLWLVAGAVGLIAASVWALPELRKPLPLAAVLLNPFLVEAVILAQLPFIWATSALFLAVGAWRRGHPAWAVVLAGAAQATHPAVLMPLTGMLAVCWFPFERERRRFALGYAVSLVIAAPAATLVLVSPVVEDSSISSLLLNFVGTISLRALVVAAPFLVVALARRGPRLLWAAAAAFAVLNLALVPVRGTAYAWGAFTRQPDSTLDQFFASPDFAPGATYRLLRVADGKVGMYQLLQHGGRLDSEFFPESIDRRSWDSATDYRAFLQRRHAAFVLIFDAYTARYHTNERDLLDLLTAQGCARLVRQDAGYTLFRIENVCSG